MTKTEERRKAKAEKRAESRRRAEARDRARDERDRKLRAAADAHVAKVKKIWADWRAA